MCPRTQCPEHQSFQQHILITALWVGWGSTAAHLLLPGGPLGVCGGAPAGEGDLIRRRPRAAALLQASHEMLKPRLHAQSSSWITATLCAAHLHPTGCNSQQSPVCNTDHCPDLAAAQSSFKGPLLQVGQPGQLSTDGQEERTAARPLTCWLECRWWLPQPWLVVSAPACPSGCLPHRQPHLRSAPACQGPHEPGTCRADRLRASM